MNTPHQFRMSETEQEMNENERKSVINLEKIMYIVTSQLYADWHDK